MTDWNLCFICQKHTNDDVRSTEDGIHTLATNIPQFDNLGGLKFDYSRVADTDDDLLSVLRTNNASYHNTCQSSYSNSKLKRLQSSHDKHIAKTSKQEDETVVPLKRSRRSVSAEDVGPNVLQCCWCCKFDDASNLRAAGQQWAGTKPDPEHVQSITHKWKHIAAAINHEHLLRSLSGGDVSSNELFYHLSCLAKHTRKYNNLKNKCNTDSVYDTWVKELYLNKIILYIKDTENSTPGTTFIAGELESMYASSLENHGIPWTAHVSRFADLLLERIPGLLKGITSNKVSLFFDSAIQHNTHNPRDFFHSLVKIVGPIRQAMQLKCQSKESNLKFDKASQIQSVPIELLAIVNFILEGIDLTEKGFSKESLSIAQTMMFNFRMNKKKLKPSSSKRHDQTKETPFPLYTAVKIYSQSRSKTLINWLYSCAGLSVSYNRLLDLTTDLSNQMLRRYDDNGVFIPSNLRKNIFTIIAKDNIDHNARSTTATKHYHGTSFSVFQFPSIDRPGDLIIDENDSVMAKSKSKKIPHLPSSYTEIRRFLSPTKVLSIEGAPVLVSPDFDDSIHQLGMNEEYDWLENAHDPTLSFWIPWAKFHASKNRATVRSLDISAILPLIDEPVHTLDMQYHCMNIISNTINILNPGQIAVDVADQPIFALTKELMMRYPDMFGPDKYFCMFGALHVEKSLLTVVGQLIKGSGIDEIMNSCGMSIVGADALVTVNHIKRARYYLQVVACTIYTKLKSAYLDSNSDEPMLAWLNGKSEESEMCYYWKIILELMVDVLIFVRSIREGRFLLYVSSLRKLIIWYFALDHYHYARWLSVHLYDLLALPQYSPRLYNIFKDGYFTFQKTDRQFSLIGLDQVHEQNNAIMKGMGGATLLFNQVDESSLARWGLCVNELASIINEYESDGDCDNDDGSFESRHHEDTNAFQNRFTCDVEKLGQAIVSNPFKLDKLTVLNNHEKASFNDSVFQDLKIICSEGERQFRDFWEKRLTSNQDSIKAPILLNSYNLPGNYNSKAAHDPVMTAVMMAKLVDAAKKRKELVEDALNTEVFGISQSLSKDQFTFHHGTKSTITDILEKSNSCKLSHEASACVVELSMLLRKTMPSWVQTFGDFSYFLYEEIMDISKSFQRCDVIADRYFEGSLKEGTRNDRGSGKGLVIAFDDSTNIPSNFLSKFLTNNTNKINLNKYLAHKFLQHHKGKNSALCVTLDDSVVSNKEEILSETDINKCGSEEADPRIIRHVINLGKQGYTNLLAKTIDSDVVILGHTYSDIVRSSGVQNFWIIYGPKETKFNVFENSDRLGPHICKGLSFFHAFTGCDSTSSFYKVGKARFWAIWSAKVKAGDFTLSRIFEALSDRPEMVDENAFDTLCDFVYAAYNLTREASFKSRRRKQLISTPNLNLRALVPSPSGVLQHIKRSAIQAGYLWKMCELETSIPDPVEWGWKCLPDGSLVPLWQSEEMRIDFKELISTCSCSRGDCSKCSCKKSVMKCLTYCKCEEDKCTNK